MTTTEWIGYPSIPIIAMNDGASGYRLLLLIPRSKRNLNAHSSELLLHNQQAFEALFEAIRYASSVAAFSL